MHPASSANRHRCAQSFVKYFAQLFHCSMFAFSLVSAFSVLFLNAALLFSAHGIGNNPIPYEIKQLCVEINIPSRTIGTRFESTSLEGTGNASVIYRCKPIWDDGGFELGFRRREAGPWQTRVELSERELLIISTLVSMNYLDRDNPRHNVFYDFALLKKLDPLLNDDVLCYKDIFSKW
uniref:CIA30 domain-containing protein n=1 Tax=Syphacia muris TaxID=451379 RepID=A0A0N5AL56_9BILA